MNASTVTGNVASGTGSVSGGLYNNGGTVTLTGTSITGNTSPVAPAPGGVYTTTAIAAGGNTISGNTPTNCLFSPAAVGGCVG